MLIQIFQARSTGINAVKCRQGTLHLVYVLPLWHLLLTIALSIWRFQWNWTSGLSPFGHVSGSDGWTKVAMFIKITDINWHCNTEDSSYKSVWIRSSHKRVMIQLYKSTNSQKSVFIYKRGCVYLLYYLLVSFKRNRKLYHRTYKHKDLYLYYQLVTFACYFLIY